MKKILTIIIMITLFIASTAAWTNTFSAMTSDPNTPNPEVWLCNDPNTPDPEVWFSDGPNTPDPEIWIN